MTRIEKVLNIKIISIILLVLFGLGGCSNNDSTETIRPMPDPYDNSSDIDAPTTPIANDETEEIKNEELKTEEPEISDSIEPGIYTFYNEETSCYLSYEERNLILSETPSDWTLSKVRAEEFFVYAEDTGLVLDID